MWHKCKTCSSLLSSEGMYWCLPCQPRNYNFKWISEIHGHWQHNDDVICRCCHTDYQCELMALKEFKLGGAL